MESEFDIAHQTESNEEAKQASNSGTAEEAFPADESIFFTLSELDQMEEDLAKQALQYGGSPGNVHTLLMPQQYRARLYFLDEDTKWVDIGTGYFRILLTRDGSEHYMQIVSEVCMPNKRRDSEEDEASGASQEEDSLPQKEDRPVSSEILLRGLISRQNDFQR